MPYIEGPKMDWTVNDGLYHRFLKWKLKCENILDCELVMLPDSKMCKNAIARSGDCGMDQYVSWCLPAAELNLETIWSKYEECCKPQANEVLERCDLLTSFHQGNRSVDEWYNAVQAQVCLATYPQETGNILHHDILWFFLKDEEFVSKAINDRSIDLDKFPASKIRQLAKRMEASKATVTHIKQVACDPQAAQINLLMHQQIDLPPGKCKTKSFQLRPQSHRQHISEQQVPHYKRKFDPKKLIQVQVGVLNVVFPSMLKDSSVQLRNTSARPVTSMDISQACLSRNRLLSNQKHQMNNCKLRKYTHNESICSQSEEFISSNDSFCLQMQIQCAQAKLKLSTTSHLITNIQAYKLQPHHKQISISEHAWTLTQM